MTHTRIIALMSITLCLVAASLAQAPLLISEIYFDAVDETYGDADETGEYIAIANPTGVAVSLTNYYISDLTNESGGVSNENYWELPALGQVNSGGFGDGCFRFPPGFSIAAGEEVLVLNGGVNWETREGIAIPGGTQVFEAFSTVATAEDMINVDGGTGAISGTNGGETFVLFYWDQASDLVVDIDVVEYNTPSSGNSFGDRDGATDGVDGPDGGAVATLYAADAGTQTDAGDADQGEVLERIVGVEGQAGGGNGIGGTDETTEDNATHWAANATPTPGVMASSVPVELSVFSTN